MNDVIIFLIAVILYAIFHNNGITTKVNDYMTASPSTAIDTAERKAALNEAHIFLSPYKDIWRNLKLSNKFCELRLGSDGKIITCTEKVLPNRQMKITGYNGIYSHKEVWNMFCTYFQYNTRYDGIIENCERYKLSYKEFISAQTPAISPKADTQKEVLKPKIDINNCSEIELTELPGISIVHAKKIIKKREEIGGFETTADFFSFLKLKEHLVKQLMPMVKAEKMRGSTGRIYNHERTIDF